jgi:Domain of unknown function (DUF4193)
MATDYDAPRRDEAELGEDSLEELKARRVDTQSASVDVDEAEAAESFELPGADLGELAGTGATDARRRVSLLALLPGASPKPAGARGEWRDDLS